MVRKCLVVASCKCVSSHWETNFAQETQFRIYLFFVIYCPLPRSTSYSNNRHLLFALINIKLKIQALRKKIIIKRNGVAEVLSFCVGLYIFLKEKKKIFICKLIRTLKSRSLFIDGVFIIHVS